MTAELLLLRLVHVLGGIVWVGSGVFTTVFLVPALAGSGPTLGSVMAGLQRRRLFTALPVVAVLTILSGLRLLWIGSGGLRASYFASGPGLTFAVSGAAATLAFLLSLLVVRPGAVRAASLAGALGRELDGLRRRGALAGRAAIALLLAGAAGMAVARYVP